MAKWKRTNSMGVLGGAMVAVVLSNAVMAAEGSSSGTRGGGEVVHTGSGSASLRDLVDNRSCVIDRADEFVESNAPALKQVLGAISDVNWYFGHRLGQEIQTLKFCVMRGGGLKKVQTEDLEGLAVYSQRLSDRTQLIAIRLDQTIYVDGDAWAMLKPSNRPYLIIHEAMHSFVGQGDVRRNGKLRNIVYAIATHLSNPMSPQIFNLQLVANGLSEFAEMGVFQPIRDEFRKALDEGADSVERYRALKRMESFCSGMGMGESQPCFGALGDLAQVWYALDAASVQVLGEAGRSAWRGDKDRYSGLVASGVSPDWEHLKFAVHGNQSEFVKWFLETYPEVLQRQRRYYMEYKGSVAYQGRCYKDATLVVGASLLGHAILSSSDDSVRLIAGSGAYELGEKVKFNLKGKSTEFDLSLTQLARMVRRDELSEQLSSMGAPGFARHEALSACSEE